MIVSYAMTTAAFIARRKRVTRRQWKASTAAKFTPGSIHEAWSASPHRKGRKIGTIRVVSCNLESHRTIVDRDWEDEGFAYMDEHGLLLGKDLSCVDLWQQWREEDPDGESWVLRFEIVSIEEGLTPEMFFGRAA